MMRVDRVQGGGGRAGCVCGVVVIFLRFCTLLARTTLCDNTPTELRLG